MVSREVLGPVSALQHQGGRMRYSRCKDVDRLVHSYTRVGWTYRRGKKHGRLYPPGCSAFVSVPGTPSDWRAFVNFQRELGRLLKRRSATH